MKGEGGASSGRVPSTLPRRPLPSPPPPRFELHRAARPQGAGHRAASGATPAFAARPCAGVDPRRASWAEAPPTSWPLPPSVAAAAAAPVLGPPPPPPPHATAPAPPWARAVVAAVRANVGTSRDAATAATRGHPARGGRRPRAGQIAGAAQARECRIEIDARYSGVAIATNREGVFTYCLRLSWVDQRRHTTTHRFLLVSGWLPSDLRLAIVRRCRPIVENNWTMSSSSTLQHGNRPTRTSGSQVNQ